MNSISIQELIGRRRRCVPLVGAVLLLALLLGGCGRGSLISKEYVWVAAPQVNLRDRVAALYNRVGTVKNGERLEVLDRQKRFVKVRTAAGLEGWVEQRYVVAEDVYNGFKKLEADNKSTASQGHGITRASLNMHLTPARDSDHLFQLKEGEKIDLLKRGTGEKAGAVSLPKPAAKPAKPTGVKTAAAASGAAGTKKKAAKAAAQKVEEETADPETPARALEDWWLVRDSDGHVGWVLSRMVDLDIPLDIAQYAEGQRIVAAYVLDYVYDAGYEPKKDDEDSAQGEDASSGASGTSSAAPAAQPGAPQDYHQRPQYLVVMTEPKDGQPFDYSQARVFTWNGKRHRYETAYRERNLDGVLPVSVGKEQFDKEGVLPTFTLRVKDEAGNVVERKYKLNQPIVRRVLAPGEQPTHATPGSSGKAGHRRGRRR